MRPYIFHHVKPRWSVRSNAKEKESSEAVWKRVSQTKPPSVQSAIGAFCFIYYFYFFIFSSGGNSSIPAEGEMCGGWKARWAHCI